MRQPSTTAPNRWAPGLVILLLGFVWGSSFILMKMGLFARDGSALIPPVQLAAMRMAIAGGTLLPISLRHFRKVPRDRWKWIAAVGFVGSFIPAILFASAQVNLPSAVAGMLNALSPLWTLTVGVIFFGVALRRRQVAGILIGLAGTAGLIAAQSRISSMDYLGSSSTALLPGLMLVLATVCYGFSVNITREKLKSLPSPLIASCTLGLVAIPASVIFALSDVPQLIATHPDGLRSLIAIGVLAAIGTAGALVLFNELLAWTNAVVAASVTYIIPIFAAMWGWWDGEPLNHQHLLAGACIILGVWITNYKKHHN